MTRLLLKTLTAILLMGSLMGCAAPTLESTATSSPTPISSPTPEPSATPTQVVCEPSEIQASEIGFSEIQGVMSSDGEVWALLFFDKAQAEQELKIVWKITDGDEELTVQARHEDGTVISPVWGPEAHEGSNWNHPGDEWGTGFNFPEPGCWTLTANRGDTTGEISLEVMPS